MGTRITIEGNDRHTFEIYFTPPGAAEKLIDRMIFTRMNSNPSPTGSPVCDR
jgi:hypothetical protein